MLGDWKLEPQTKEEARECETIEGMRKRLNRYSRVNPMTRAVFDAAHYRGLSGDDTMTWLAFEALRRLERLEGLMLEQAMRSPHPLVFVDSVRPQENVEPK